MSATSNPLSYKQRAFVELYLATWNAVEAAKRAGYNAPQVTSVRLMRRPEIQAAVAERLKGLALEADEIIARLSQQARVNPALFFEFCWVTERDADGDAVIDETGAEVQRRVMMGIRWEMFEQYGYLVKKLSYDRKGRAVLEFHDPQHALELLGRAKKLFVDRSEITGADGGAIEVIRVAPQEDMHSDDGDD